MKLSTLKEFIAMFEEGFGHLDGLTIEVFHVLHNGVRIDYSYTTPKSIIDNAVTKGYKCSAYQTGSMLYKSS